MIKRKAEIFYNNKLAGYLSKDSGQYIFQYAEEYIESYFDKVERLEF